MTLNTWSAGAETVRASVPPWTGRLRAGLVDDRSWPIGDAELVIGLDTVTLHIENRKLAVMGRERFRAWLSSPEEPYEVGDVVWDGEGHPQERGSAKLTIDGRTHCWVENIAMSVLKGLI